MFMENKANPELPANHAWQIGAAIEAGVEAQEARRRIASGEVIVPVVGGVLVGGVVATKIGLGGVGLAFGGGAIGISAATAIAAPTVAVAAASYTIYRSIRGVGSWSRVKTLRGLVGHFQSTNQHHHADRVFHVEGRGQLEEKRLPPTHSSTRATLRVVAGSESSAMMGLFCSPSGDFVLTYDLQPDRWAYVTVMGDDKFNGGGTDLRGQDLQFDDLNSVDLLLRILEREGFVTLRQDTDNDSG